MDSTQSCAWRIGSPEWVDHLGLGVLLVWVVPCVDVWLDPLMIPEDFLLLFRSRWLIHDCCGGELRTMQRKDVVLQKLV